MSGFIVNIRWGHLDRMPKCEHGRVEGFCACFDQPISPLERAKASYRPLQSLDEIVGLERERRRPA